MHRRHMPALMALVACLVLPACDGSATSGANASAITIDASKVPEDLRSLVPIVQAWGIGDDVDRGEKVDAATAEEKQQLRDALAPHQDRITAWLNSFGQGVMPDEAAAFMYAQLALEEMGTGGDR